MPAHNEARFIRDAIQSIQLQTYRPVELLLVDDGSTDETVAVAMSVGGPVPIRVLHHDRPKGSIASRNWGLYEASTEWVAMLDADDVWMPQKLEQQCKFIESWNGKWPIAVLGVKGRHINEAGEDIGACDIGVTTAEAYWMGVEDGGVATIATRRHSFVVTTRWQLAVTTRMPSELRTSSYGIE